MAAVIAHPPASAPWGDYLHWLAGRLHALDLTALLPGDWALVLVAAAVALFVLLWLLAVVVGPPAAKPAAPTPPPTIRMYGREFPCPPFFDRALTPFYKVAGKHEAHQLTRVGWTYRMLPIDPDSYDRGRMYQAFIHSVMAERLRRGFPIRDRMNAVDVFDMLPDAGFVVERYRDDDGREMAIVATGFGDYLDGADDDAARLAGLGVSQEWGRAAFYKGWQDTPPNNWMPLFRVTLGRVAIAAPVGADPLAPPSTEKGGARFAWPFAG